MIYGHALVMATKQRNNLRWLVSTVEGKELIAIPWRLVYDQTELVVNPRARSQRGKYDPDKLLALETCLLLCPLDEDDESELKRKYPGLATKTAWVIDQALMNWLPSEYRPPVRQRENNDSGNAPARSMSEPVVEVADPERKLLF